MEIALPNMSIRMCLLVTPNQAASSLNSALNLWKSPLKGSSFIVICAKACQALEAWLEGMNFSMKLASILVKVQSSSLTFLLVHFISHPSVNDFPQPMFILLRNARILFFSS